ncbi:YceI family protein [Longimicrobium terrae]|uniref:Polyisoprenoid-binding protein YceI n=1 Tax=Longimicrobium terrae TaxID=1639882 RepID=A0A841H5R2_9BACT|nr:YceI family protein [Longimicrobium terrae]MBB4639105.1 polyisoprenoid-binding protein YceI [Longimicrobium terrae]MBB6073294.1 polyisoprenoid-binding protein YceI [Longimicrobium terrae]NNC28734.1 polyisoprenoid-binding protein [Longimicrobium terrae]
MSNSTEATSGVTTWNIDPAHTTVEFSVKHLMISTVRGHFGAVTGTIALDEANPLNSTVTAEIDVTSIDTRQAQRDEHLRSADFFDVAQFPSIKFTSTRVERDGDHYDVIGNLTIRDVTKEVVLHTSDEGRAGDPWGGQRAAFSATTKVDRRDFGLTYNQVLETGGVMVGTDIKISLEIQAVKA